MSLEAFLDPSFEAFAEWVNGTVVYMTVSDEHDVITGFFYTLLRHLAEERGSGKAKAAPSAMRLASQRAVREPDVMYISNAKLPHMRRTYLDGPADIVIEVVNEESRTRDLRDKFYEYAMAGVPEYWIVDPDRTRTQVFVLSEQGVYEGMLVENGILRSRVLPEFWVREEWLRPETMPKVSVVLKEWGLL